MKLSEQVYFIAEAGVNHNGNIDLAKELIDKAVEAGADAVKFQLFNSKELATDYADMADYQIENTKEKQSQVDMLSKLELSREDHIKLKEYCSDKNIDFISSPFDIDSAYFLNELGMKFFKVPSGELINIPFLRTIASFKKPVVLSTGMANLNEVNLGLQTLLDAGLDRNLITILHCNTEYPTPLGDVNLKAMLTIKNECNIAIGYSDHTAGIEVLPAAVAMGAEVVEKHFTLDKTMEGPDHAASLDPKELKEIITRIRMVETMLGSDIKTPSNSEIKNIEIVRKSIVANSEIKEGEIITEKMLTTKRPGNGISPLKWDEIIGSKAIKNFSKDEQITI